MSAGFPQGTAAPNLVKAEKDEISWRQWCGGECIAAGSGWGGAGG